MYSDRPSKNLMTTLPRTASHTTTSATNRVRSRPSTLPMKLRSVWSISSVARCDARVALALLLADREQRDARVRDVHHALGEDGAHPRVLGQVLGRGVGVGADVEQQERHRAGQLDRERRPVDAGQRAEDQLAGGEARPGVAGRHDGVGLPVLDELGGDADGALLLARERPRRVLVHPHDLGAVDEPDVGRGVAGELAHERLVADEDDGVGRMLPRPLHGAGHDLGRAVVAAHGVHGDADTA